jgi:hypothetical protein
LSTSRIKKGKTPKNKKEKTKKSAEEVDTSKRLKDLLFKKKHKKGKLAPGGALA